MAKEQKRATNFTPKEEFVLISLAKKYIKVLECKQTDTQTGKQKTECWKRIEKDFNSINDECYRSERVLKKKYDNLKKRWKRKFAHKRTPNCGSGGGPPKEIEVSDTDMQIYEILRTRTEGNFSESDNDEADGESIIMDIENLVEVNPNQMIISTDEIDHNNTDTIAKEITKSCYKSDQVSCNDEVNHTEGKLHQSDENISKRVSQWVEAKETSELSRRDFMQKEAEFKLQALKEKHRLDMEIMKKKADMELEHMQKEHEARMAVISLSVKK